MKIRILLLAVTMSTVVTVRANAPMPTINTTSPVATSVANESAVITSQAQDTSQKAAEWGLSEQEWNRYEDLKKGARGIWSPNLDPLTTLGIEATSEAERMKYARLLARKEFERVDKELRFQRAYDAAFKELYPHVKPIQDDVSNVSNMESVPGRLLLFTQINDCKRCDTMLSKLLAKDLDIDIYLIDSDANDNKIRDWAVKHRIDVNKVRNRQITLNHHNKSFLLFNDGKIPAIFRVTPEGEWVTVPY